jgi:antitoxin YefM
MKTTTYSAGRERLASLIEDVISTREVALITRRGYEPVAIIPAEELVGLVETAQLVRSPMPDGFCKPSCGFTKAVKKARR